MFFYYVSVLLTLIIGYVVNIYQVASFEQRSVRYRQFIEENAKKMEGIERRIEEIWQAVKQQPARKPVKRLKTKARAAIDYAHDHGQKEQ